MRMRFVRCPAPVRRRDRGITLLECLIVVAMLAMAALAAAPSFEAMRGTLAVDGTARALMAAMRMARSEAMGRQRRIALAPADGNDWSSGWVTFVDEDLDDRFSEGDRLLGRYAPLPAGVTITTHLALMEGNVIAYAENGFALHRERQRLSGTVKIRGHGRSVCLTLNGYGRPRVRESCDA